MEELARLFDRLEEGRKYLGKDEDGEELGGKLGMFKALRGVFREIDARIAGILGLNVDVDALWEVAWDVMERRVKGAERVARPGAAPIAEEGAEGRRGRRRGGGSADLTQFF